MDWLVNPGEMPWMWILAAFAAGALVGGLVSVLGDRRRGAGGDADRERDKYLLEAQLRGKQEELRRLSVRASELTAFAINFPQKVHELNAALSAEDLANILSRACTTMLGTSSLQVLLLDSAGKELVVAHCIEDGQEAAELRGLRLPASEGWPAALLEQATVRDASALRASHPALGEPALELGQRRFPLRLAAPLRARESTRGVINLSWLPPGESRHPEELLGCLAQVAAMSLENLRSIDRARQEARLDGMTRLLNHASFKQALGEMLDRARPRGLPVSVFLFDLDNFKHYNDNNGHPAGDALLKSVSGLFRSQMRPVDTAARYGGEEFIAMLPGCTKQQALKVAERIRKLISTTPLPHGDKQPLGRISISGGVASYPEDGADGEDLVRNADVALYQAKEGGRNRVVPFDYGMVDGVL